MSEKEITRGGLKLEAAFAHFGLAARVTGGQAIDVGASTGGFTEVMLRAGAARVTAIDVGHGQLLPRLREDPRVEVLERSDFKTLALKIAPGLFDFFTVDVSFVAARSMLRGLAFRLRPGAEGVVLVKPQFEVPGHLVKGGDVSDVGLRARAVAVFAGKAAALGFELLGQVDSPVPGGEGTVEILTHLRFSGRTEKLPALPGAEGEATEARTAKPSGGGDRRLRGEQRWFAAAAPGLEGVLLAEVEKLPHVRVAEKVAGGVEFAGEFAAGMAANLRLRTATRVLVRLGTVRAREFAKLRHLVAKLPWRSFVDGKQPLRFEVTARSSRLYHTGAVAETLALAIEDRVGRKVTVAPPLKGPNKAEGEEEAAAGPGPLRIFARGENDQWTLSVDSSGELLHRRGWRTEAGEAPLRETLAAGLLALAGYDPARPLVDLMCGAGTIVIEAAAQAQGLAPGQGRGFAFEGWPAFEQEAWEKLRGAGPAKTAARAGLFGFDRDEAAIAIATRNAARAGVGELITFKPAELRAAPSDSDTDYGLKAGLVIVNPPYGRRLGQRGEAARLVRVLGQELRRRFAGWTAGILLADPAWARALGFPVRETFALFNGGLRVSYVIADVPARAPKL